jgi:hypothetical protein
MVAGYSVLPDGDFALAGEYTPQKKAFKKHYFLLSGEGVNLL